jgi:hypothetical protein
MDLTPCSLSYGVNPEAANQMPMFTRVMAEVRESALVTFMALSASHFC